MSVPETNRRTPQPVLSNLSLSQLCWSAQLIFHSCLVPFLSFFPVFNTKSLVYGSILITIPFSNPHPVFPFHLLSTLFPFLAIWGARELPFGTATETGSVLLPGAFRSMSLSFCMLTTPSRFFAHLLVLICLSNPGRALFWYFQHCTLYLSAPPLAIYIQGTNPPYTRPQQAPSPQNHGMCSLYKIIKHFIYSKSQYSFCIYLRWVTV